MKTFLIVAVFLLILWQLGASLYHMMNDKGQSDKTAKALTRRVALSVGLILCIVAAHYLGLLEFHGVGRAP